jgi:hypothetical protein
LDDVITPSEADRLEAWLRTHSELEARGYPQLDHWMSAEQLDDVGAFLRGALSGPAPHRTRL